MARALELKFSHEGFEVKVAANGEEALALVDTELFDLILLDLVMPKMNGFEVLKSLAEKGKPIPVIVLSNLSQAEDEAKVRALGAKGFFIKSNVPIADIVAHVKRVLV